MIKAAILGASGYTGAELVRLIDGHPKIDVAALTADRKAGSTMAEAFPHLGHLDLPVLSKIGDVDWDGVDIVFCCLPHATTQTVLNALPTRLKIVDLSADFRLRDPDAYAEWYGGAHQALELQEEVVYGLPEFYREQIAGARIVANTGCYVAAALLPLLPALAAKAIAADPIIVDAASGVSGAGRGLKEGSLFAEVSEGFSAYGVGGHRHVAEIDQECSKISGETVRPSFTPHLLPQNRGILATIYVQGEAEAIHGALTETYATEFFVHVKPLGQTPHTRHVRGSNFAHIGVVADRAPGRAIIVSALDNLVRGASGQALQNANIMLGFDETLGLRQAPLFP